MKLTPGWRSRYTPTPIWKKPNSSGRKRLKTDFIAVTYVADTEHQVNQAVNQNERTEYVY